MYFSYQTFSCAVVTYKICITETGNTCSIVGEVVVDATQLEKRVSVRMKHHDGELVAPRMNLHCTLVGNRTVLLVCLWHFHSACKQKSALSSCKEHSHWWSGSDQQHSHHILLRHSLPACFVWAWDIVTCLHISTNLPYTSIHLCHCTEGNHCPHYCTGMDDNHLLVRSDALIHTQSSYHQLLQVGSFLQVAEDRSIFINTCSTEATAHMHSPVVELQTSVPSELQRQDCRYAWRQLFL